jgi:hypothetical protein
MLMAMISGALIELCERVQAWRAQEGGGPGKRVPEELWERAVRVARVDGLTATARATRLSYDRLKQRSGAQDGGVVTRASKLKATPNAIVHGGVVKRETAGDGGTRFVALQVAPQPTAGKQATIELIGRHGERMRVEIQGELDLTGLVQAFRSMQS